jgi:hypothetical protein
VLRWLGRLSTLISVLVLTGASLIGIATTLIAGQRPGVLLGIFITAGSLAAVLGIRRASAYLLFPLPVIAFFFGALITGIVHDSQLASTTAGFGTSFLQWVSGVFVPMVVATIVVVVIGGGRWLFGSQLITRRSPQSSGGRNVGPGPGPRTGETGPGPRAGGTGPGPRAGGTGPVPRMGGTGPAPRMGSTGPVPRPGAAGPVPRPDNTPRPGRGGRPGRDPRTDRDPWGDPRLPPTGGQPAADPRQRPAGPSQPRNGQQPRDGQAPYRGQRPSWNPAARPQGRPQPPDGWQQRLANQGRPQADR